MRSGYRRGGTPLVQEVLACRELCSWFFPDSCRDPQGSNVGSLKLTLYDVPPDPTGSIGAPVTLTTGPVPGQNALLSFSGLAGQRVSLGVSGSTIGSSTCCSANVSILRPDGPALVMRTLFGTSGGCVDTKTLPATGTYSVVVDPSGGDVGRATLQLYEVPPDLTGSLAAGGVPASLTLGTPDQNAGLTFSGAAGQRVTIPATNVTTGPSTKVHSQRTCDPGNGSNSAPPHQAASGRPVRSALP